MNWIRTESEQALQALLISIEHAIHFYQTVAEWEDAEPITSLFVKLTEERKALQDELERALKLEGDLPTAVDPDREAVQLLIQEAEVLISDDRQQKIAEEALEVEKEIEKHLQEAEAADKSHLHGNAFRLIRASGQRARDKLTALL